MMVTEAEMDSGGPETIAEQARTPLHPIDVMRETHGTSFDVWISCRPSDRRKLHAVNAHRRQSVGPSGRWHHQRT